MYRIEYERDAIKALRAMPRNVMLTITGKLELLAEDPAAAPNVIKLVGQDSYRLRVGNWRVIFNLEQRQEVADTGEIVTVDVVDVRVIAPRGSAYQ